jgi:hypothetical protein
MVGLAVRPHREGPFHRSADTERVRVRIDAVRLQATVTASWGSTTCGESEQGSLDAWLFRSGGLKYAAAFTSLVVLAAAEAFSVEENTSYFIGLYWAVTTVTTVGYGDKLPTTTEAEITAMTVMVVGIGFFAALAGTLANLFIEGRAKEIAAAERQALSADEALLARVDAIAEQLQELPASLRTPSD